MGLRKRCNFMTSEIILYASERPSSTSTLQDQHLPVPFAKPTPTSTLCEADTYQYSCGANTYQYPLQSQHLPIPLRNQHLLVLIARSSSTNTLWYEMTPNIVWGADFNMIRGAVFSIVRGAVFSIVRGDTFSIVRGGTFVEMLHWVVACSELNSWLHGIAWMRLCAVSGDQVRWPGQMTRSLH